MLLKLSVMILTGIVLIGCSSSQKPRVRRQSMKVRINATGDTIVLKFVRPNPDTKLEGYILGYGGAMFSKQFIQLPEDGEPYHAEMDAEPKYLVAVQPVPGNDVKKQCTGKVNLEKPLHLVIGSVTPTTVLLSWGTLLSTPYGRNIMKDCLEDGHYTVRYKERDHNDWNYQTCPTSDTVIDNLKPDTPYEFAVRPEKEKETGVWSKPVVHNTNMDDKPIKKPINPRAPNRKPGKPLMVEPQGLFPPRQVIHKRNQTRLSPIVGKIPGPPRTSLGRNISKNSTSSKGSAAVVPARTLAFRGRDVNFPPRASNFSQTSMRQGGSPGQRPTNSKKANLLVKPRGKGKIGTLNQTNVDFIVKPKLTPVTPKPVKEIKGTTTATPIANGSRFDVWDNSTILSSVPASDVDVMGKKRYIAPHVKFWPGKKPDEPCSITNSLSYFPEEESGEQNVTGPPRLPPSNLTVVTVEGCPSFVILDWEKTDNETKEYEVISRTNGPDGEEISVTTTNQTHTAVENLKPESSYEFKVKPKNELGEGPATDPVSFSTESADPRVSDNLSGKNAIWTPYPFNADSYSECSGKQYVKRTWYRKFVGIQLCNSLRYKIYLSDTLSGKFYNIGDQTGQGEDHCQFVDSFLDGRTGNQVYAHQLPLRAGYFRAIRQQPVSFGEIGGHSHITYVPWYECGVPIPGKW